MALKPTIYKARIALSDLEREHYADLNLTLAQHPSENQERLMARLLAYVLNAQDALMFTRGLSEPDEPDICARSLDDQLQLWIDVGEPAFDRIKKATRVAKAVKVYSFNTKSDVWWSQEAQRFAALPVEVYRFPWAGVQVCVALLERTMELSITVAGQTLYLSSNTASCELTYDPLQRLSH